MSIRSLIKNPPTEREAEVTDGGKTYKLRGKPTPDVLARGLMANPNEDARMAAHFSRALGVEFPKELVSHISLVHLALVPDEGEEPYDILEIAQLAAQEPLLFAKLSDASYIALGIVKADGQAAESPVAEAAAGNSEKPGDSKSSSTSGASKPAEKSTPSS